MRLAGGGNGCKEMLGRERTVEVYRHKTHFLALGNEMINSFLGGLGNRTHGYNHTFGIGSAVVVEEMVFAACDPGDFGHVAFHDFGHSLIVVLQASRCWKNTSPFSAIPRANRLLGLSARLRNSARASRSSRGSRSSISEFRFSGFRARCGNRRRSLQKERCLNGGGEPHRRDP